MSRSTTTAVIAAVLASMLTGCGSSESDHTAANEPLEIWFRTLYSAHIPTGPDFQVPAVVDGVKPTNWEVVPADAAQLEANEATYSVLITTRRAGKFSLVARAGNRTGSVDLRVTEGTAELLTLGAARFDNGVALDPADVFGGRMAPNAACTNCHGAAAGLVRIELTPRQLGGYSDEELAKIITLGTKPLGAPDTAAFAFPLVNGFSSFHRWSATPDQVRGLVLYLRSLPPAAMVASQMMGGGSAGSSSMAGAGGGAEP